VRPARCERGVSPLRGQRCDCGGELFLHLTVRTAEFTWILVVELAVISLAEILDKIARPGTAVAGGSGSAGDRCEACGGADDGNPSLDSLVRPSSFESSAPAPSPSSSIPRLDPNRRYCRPWRADFVEDPQPGLLPPVPRPNPK